MKFKEKIKIKLNNFKANTSRFNALSLSDWLNTNGLEENAENRAKYTRYKLEIDEKNKQQDKNLSKFIGSALFLVVFLVIFCIMCANSVGASELYGQNGYNDFEYPSYTEYHYIDLAENPDDECHLTIIFIGESQEVGYIENQYALISNSEYFYNLITPLLPNNFYDLDYEGRGEQIYYIINDIYGSSIHFESYLCLNNLYNNCRLELALKDEIFTNGYNAGYLIGYENGEIVGFENGEIAGFDRGYIKGETDGLNAGETLKKGIFAIFDAPVQMLQQILNFEIMGINLYSIFTFIVTLCLLAILTKTIFGLFN